MSQNLFFVLFNFVPSVTNFWNSRAHTLLFEECATKNFAFPPWIFVFFSFFHFSFCSQSFVPISNFIFWGISCSDWNQLKTIHFMKNQNWKSKPTQMGNRQTKSKRKSTKYENLEQSKFYLILYLYSHLNFN
jgi:hypothetical protein